MLLTILITTTIGIAREVSTPSEKSPDSVELNFAPINYLFPGGYFYGTGIYPMFMADRMLTTDLNQYEKQTVIPPSMLGALKPFTIDPINVVINQEPDNPLIKIYVNDAEGNDNYNGLYQHYIGGLNGPKKTIQAGINAAPVADAEVIVARGVYRGGNPGENSRNRDLDFNGKAITVRSTAGYEDGSSPIPYCASSDCLFWDTVRATIIDCDGTLNDSHRGFIFHTGEDSNSVARGFTIKDGFINPDKEFFTHYTLTGGYPPTEIEFGGGGAILCKNSSPTIEYNIIRDNQKDIGQISRLPIGGAILCIDSNAEIRYNFIFNNKVMILSSTIGILPGRGGGIGGVGSSPVITHNVIEDNIAGFVDERVGDNEPLISSGIQTNQGMPTHAHTDVASCECEEPDGDNLDKLFLYVDGRGGGIYLRSSNRSGGNLSNPEISYNYITNNTVSIFKNQVCPATRCDYVVYGGGICCDDTIDSSWPVNPKVIGNYIIENQAIIKILNVSGKSLYVASGGGFCGIVEAEGTGNPGRFRENIIAGNIVEIRGNLAIDEPAEAMGGGIYTTKLDSNNNDIIDNIATIEHATGSSYASAYGGGIAIASGDVDVINSIIWNNEVKKGGEAKGHQLAAYNGVIKVTYSDITMGDNHIYGQIQFGDGNIHAPPSFIRSGYWISNNYIPGDYHLKPNSPCIDTGDPNFVPLLGETDIDAEPRIQYFKTYPCRVDMGADEVPGPSEVNCDCSK